MHLLLELVAHILSFLLARWLTTHQHTRLGRFLLRHHGPRQDVQHMSHRQQYRSAGTFFLYGIITGGLLAATIYGHMKIGIADDNIVYVCLLWFLQIFTLLWMGAAIYLFACATVGAVSRFIKRRYSKPPMSTWSPPADARMLEGAATTGSHKKLKSVVRSFVESFTSYANYYAGDLAMGHVVRAAWASGATGFRFDLLYGAHDASPLFVPEVGHAIAQYAAWLPHLVVSSESSMRFVCRAELVVTVDPAMRRPSRYPGRHESPFTCLLRITDDRGKEYSHRLTGWSSPNERKRTRGSRRHGTF